MKRKISSFLAVCIVIIMAGCSSGGATIIGVSGINLSGPWNGHLDSDTTVTVHIIHISFSQDQGVTTVTGTASFTLVANGDCYSGGTFSGTFDGFNIILTFSDRSGATITFDGQLASAGKLSGTYVSSGLSETTDTTDEDPPAEEEAARGFAASSICFKPDSGKFVFNKA